MDHRRNETDRKNEGELSNDRNDTRCTKSTTSHEHVKLAGESQEPARASVEITLFGVGIARLGRGRAMGIEPFSLFVYSVRAMLLAYCYPTRSKVEGVLKFLCSLMFPPFCLQKE